MRFIMNAKQDLEKQVVKAAQEYGISNVLFRNAIGRKLGLNIADMECLSLLLIKGISTPTELARYTGLTTGSATVMLDRLETAKLITRKPNPKDRRGVLIEVNKESAATVGPLVAGVQKALRELAASYSDKELKTIADYLTRYTKNATEQTDSIDNNSV